MILKLKNWSWGKDGDGWYESLHINVAMITFVQEPSPGYTSFYVSFVGGGTVAIFDKDQSQAKAQFDNLIAALRGPEP